MRKSDLSRKLAALLPMSLVVVTLVPAMAQTAPAAPVTPVTPVAPLAPGTAPAAVPLDLGEANIMPNSIADQRNQAAEATTPLLLEEALVLALKNSPLRVAARDAEIAARARIGTARSAGGLQVNLGGTATLSHNVLSGLGGGGGSTVGTTSGAGSGASGIPETFPTTGTGFSSSSSGASAGAGSTTSGSGVAASSVALRQTGTTTSGTTGGTTGSASGGNLSNVFGGSSGYFNNNESLNLAASFSIYNGGRVKASTRQAQYAALATAAQTLQTESDILLATTNAYLGVLRAGQLLEVTDSNLAVARERRRVAGVRFAAGAAARLEVFTADTVLSDAVQRRITASNGLAQSKATLNSLIGRNPETPLRVEPIATLIPRIPFMIGVAAPGQPPTAPLAPLAANGGAAPATTPVASTGGAGTAIEALGTMSSADLRSLTDKSRASLEVARQQVNIQHAGVDLARAQRKPSLGLSLTGLLTNPVTAIVSRFGAILGLSLAQNLFDSGRSHSQIAEAQALLDQQQQNLRNQRINLYNQIEQSLLQFDSAQKSVASADVAVTSSQEAVRAAQLGYLAGARINLDVSDAQFNLLQSQTAAVNARFDAAIAQVLLAAAVGVSTETGRAAYQQALREEAQRVLTTQTAAQGKKRRR